MVSDVKISPNFLRPATARILAVGLIAALSPGWTETARADNELERLWKNIWGQGAKPAPQPAAPAPKSAPPAAAPAASAQPAETAPAPAAQPAPSQPAAPTVPVVLPKVQAVSETLDVTGNAEAVNRSSSWPACRAIWSRSTSRTDSS